jgi:hypothetical protein
MIKQTWGHKVFFPALAALFVCANSYAAKDESNRNLPDTSADQAHTATAKTKGPDIRQVATGGDNGVGEVSTGGDNGVGELSTDDDNGVGEMPADIRKVPEKRPTPEQEASGRQETLSD